MLSVSIFVNEASKLFPSVVSSTKSGIIISCLSTGVSGGLFTFRCFAVTLDS